MNQKFTMKNITIGLCALYLFAILTACSKKPIDVTGQIFVVTKSRENIKMGGLEVLVIPDAEFQTMAKTTVSWMQEEARAEAQRKIDSDHMTAFIREVMDMVRESPMPIPELKKVRMSIVDESGTAKNLLESALAGDLLRKSFGKLISSSTSSVKVSTDADGRFAVPLKGKTWFIAGSQREVGDETEQYRWLKSYEPIEGAATASMSVSNESDIQSEAELYGILSSVIGSSGDLQEFQKVEVSEKMKSMVAKHRVLAKSAKENAEREAAEARANFQGKKAGEERDWEIAPGVKMTFCWCPAGSFTMGSSESEADRNSNEKQVKVTLTKGFWMAKTEVTQAQWRALMGNNPSNFKGDNLPVEKVSWLDAQHFLEKLNTKIGNTDGGKMVLPAEAQWEYACRAGELGPYSGGKIDEVAWYSNNSDFKTHPVGMKKSNAWGLHDMHGNVWEWCADWYDDSLSGGTDPSGASSGVYRVTRGGSWYYVAAHCRAAFRFWIIPDSRNRNLGFRPALVQSE